MTIKVLHCLAAVATGGVERRRLILARHLDPARFEQRVVTREVIGDCAAALGAAGVPVRLLGRGSRRLLAPAPIVQAMKLAREWRPDIVHGAVFEALPMTIAAGRSCGAKVVIEETSYATNRSWRGHGLFRAFVSAADACVAVSEPVAAFLRSRTHVPPGKIHVIENGVIAPTLPGADEVASLRHRLGLKSDALVIGTVCRLFPSKRVDHLIQATATLLPEFPRLMLLVVGDGPERGALEQLTNALGLGAHVVFAGHRDDVGTVMSTMDVFCLTSEHESFGLVLAEAMLCGLPVVAMDVGGIPTVVERGKTGLLVPLRNPTALAEGLRYLLADPEKRQAFGQAGRVRARIKFSAERYASDVQRFYEELVG